MFSFKMYFRKIKKWITLVHMSELCKIIHKLLDSDHLLATYITLHVQHTLDPQGPILLILMKKWEIVFMVAKQVMVIFTIESPKLENFGIVLFLIY